MPGLNEIAGQLTVTVYDWEAVQPDVELVAVTVNVYVPGVVGMPDKVFPLKVRPVGSVPLVLHVNVPVPPVCVKAWLMVEPTVI